MLCHLCTVKWIIYWKVIMSVCIYFLGIFGLFQWWYCIWHCPKGLNGTIWQNSILLNTPSPCASVVCCWHSCYRFTSWSVCACVVFCILVRKMVWYVLSSKPCWSVKSFVLLSVVERACNLWRTLRIIIVLGTWHLVQSAHKYIQRLTYSVYMFLRPMILSSRQKLPVDLPW